MNHTTVVVCLLSALSLMACGKKEDASGSASGSASAEATAAAAATGSAAATAKAALAAPRIGGNVVAAGDFSVEVAAHQSGLVEALVLDASGKAVTDAKLAVTAAAKGGATEKVELAFAAPRARFEGHAKAGVELASGPLDVSLEVAGKPAVNAKLADAVVLPSPELGGHVLAVGDLSAEVLVRPSGAVAAIVRDSAGAKLETGIDCKVALAASGGANTDIALKFEPPRACFAGKAAAGVSLTPGPLSLSVSGAFGTKVGGLASASLVADAAHGGQVIAVGDFSVELVAKGSEIAAFVFDASGKAHAVGDLDLSLALGAKGDTNLALKWDAPSLSYKGRAAANLDLSIEPIQVSLKAAGKAFVGAVASLKAAAAASAKLDATAKLDVDAKAAADADAKLGAKADIDAKLKVPDVKAKVDATAAKAAAVAATAKVAAPKVEVNKSASASAGSKAGGGAKASAGFSFGTK